MLGSVANGLILHPDNEHLIYPLGSTVVVRHVLTRTQTFLRGHDNPISTIAVSKSGSMIASGQKTHMGFPADIIVWDFATRQAIHRLRLHKVCIQSLAFSHTEMFLASLGGEDDNSLVVWDLRNGSPVCGSPAYSDCAKSVKFFETSDRHLMSVGNYHARLWTFDLPNKKLRPIDCKMAALQRLNTCVVSDDVDEKMYIGTQSGDVLEVAIASSVPSKTQNPFGTKDGAIGAQVPARTLAQQSALQVQTPLVLAGGLFKRAGPPKKRFSLGVTALARLKNGDLLVGTGDGQIAKMSGTTLTVTNQCSVLGSVTSISLTNDHTHFFAATSSSNIYWGDCATLTCELRSTCHSDRINGIAFPTACSDVFATSSSNDVRVWNSKTRQELLRIQVPGIECFAVDFTRDGKSIITGWSDGKFRAFFPQSGRLMYVINDAHRNGVTAIASTNDCTRVVTGGMDGEVRVWKVSRQTQVMEASLKEHRGRVWSIKLRQGLPHAVSASSDGSVIIWDLSSYTRVMCLFESTLFKTLAYHPDEAQLLTGGSDRKIAYWDTFDGAQIRNLEAMTQSGAEGEVSTISITRNGSHFVCGGETRTVMLWDYDLGVCKYEGEGHAGAITASAIAPNQSFIVTVGAEGGIFFWKTPQEVYQAAHKDDDGQYEN